MSFWDRVGAIFDSAKEMLDKDVPAPVGAIVGLASNLSSPLHAATSVGREVAKKAGDAFFKTTPGQGVAAAAQKGLTWAERNIWSPPTDYVEASGRYYQDVASDPQNRDFGKYTAATFGLGVLDPAFRDEYYPAARANDSSIMQSMWEMERAAKGNEKAGYQDKDGKWVLPLIDDPAERHAREAYFDRGAQKWTTGIGDAAFSIILDPLNVATAGAGKVVQSARQLTGKSIEQAANASRGAGAAAADDFVRGAANTADVQPGTLRLGAEDFTEAVDDGPRAYLRSKLGDDGVQELFDRSKSILDGEGDKTSALTELLNKHGIDSQKVLDDARYSKGGGKLTPEGILRSASDDLMEKNGVEALFEKSDTLGKPMYRKGEDIQDSIVNNMGWNAKKYKSNVEKLTDYAWDAKGKPGTVAAISDDFVLGQSSDTGAIADAMAWVAATVDDEKVAKGVMDDLQYAAAGNGGALRRIEAFNTRMAKDIEAMATLDRTAALDALNSSPLKTPAEKLKTANSDDLFVRMRADIEPELTEMMDKFSRFQSATDRVRAAGTLGGIARGGLKDAGDITRLPLVGTWQPFRSLPPVRFLGGTHIPGRMELDDPEAATMYGSWLDKQTAKLGLDKSQYDLDLTGSFKDDFTAAADTSVNAGIGRSARANAVYRANEAFKGNLIKKYAAMHDVPEDEVKLWIDTALDVRKTEVGAIVQGARSSVESGSAVITRLPDGTPVATAPELSHALGTPQFQEAADLTDWAKMDKWLGERFKPGFTERLAAGTAEEAGPGKVSKGLTATSELLEEVNDAWKVLALTRVAYPLRVQMDTQARNMATMGALRYMDFLFKGVGNFNQNTKFVDKQVVELVQRKRQAFDELAYLMERGENDERVEGLQKILDMDADAWKASGQSQVEPGFIKRSKTDFKTIQGSGEKVNLKTGKYERDTLAPYPRGAASMEQTLGEGVEDSVEGLYKSANAYFQKKLRKQLGYNFVDYGTSPATRKAWTQGYLEAVNHGLRNDASWGRMAAGADDDSIIDWMRTAPDGKAYFKELNRSGHFSGPEELVGRQRAHFDNLVPDREKADIVAARDITPDDIAEWWAGDNKTRPFVPTKIHETMEHQAKSSIYDVYDASRKYYFKFAAQMPETYMGRHPQYQRFFQANMQRYLKASDRSQESLTLQEINGLRKRADQSARRDMAKIMFDTSHKTELGHHLRFISPFFSAWEDTMFKWSKIAVDNPTATYNTLVRPFEALTSTNNVYDKDGNRIMPNGEVRRINEDGSLGDVVGNSHSWNDGYMVFTMPDWITPGEGKQDFRLSRGSLNAIFQGEDWWSPGVGPVVQIPLNEAIKGAFPEMGSNPVVEHIMPYGATDESVVEQTMPSHWKNFKDFIQGEGSEGFTDTFNIAMQDELVRQRQTGKTLSEKETIARVTKATRNLLLMKWIGSSASPASTTPQSRLDWYRKEYRRYQQKDPKNAVQNFQKDYPEFSEVTISLKKNETGISATEEAQNAADPWKSEIDVNPEIGWAFAGPDNYKGEFKDSIYTHQSALGWRTKEPARDTFDRINISRGWQDWQTLSNIIDVELDRRGLSSLLSKGAEDLVALKAEAKADIMRDNPSWAEEYAGGGGGADKAVIFLNKMNGAMTRNPKKTESRPDLKLLQQYMADRELARETMAQYGVSSLPSEEDLAAFMEGTKTGDAARYAIAYEWYRSVGELKQDPVFGDMYSRAGLERDTLENPVVVG